ncbi:hypothetical protein MNBD_GAMMA07-2447 [hydrothermal vent metagenome]|uniref:Uncharacterized protein n=1 Tax=hydrothermal vent metagenome TaxID=652676 RepID=A0A3B0WZY7_9ZZZZ
MDNKERLRALAKSFKLPIPINADEDALKGVIAEAMVKGDIIVVKHSRLAAPPKRLVEEPLTSADLPQTFDSAPITPAVIAELDNGLNQSAQAATLIKAAEDGTPFCKVCKKTEQAIAPASINETRSKDSNVALIVAAVVGTAPVVGSKISDNILGPVTPEEEPQFFTELEFLYEDNSVIEEGVAYVATFSDGSQQAGTLDNKGFARIDGIPEGQVDVVFGDPEAEKQLATARTELNTYLKGVVAETQARAKPLDAELNKLNALQQGVVLTGALLTGLYDEALDVAAAAKQIAETGIDMFNEIDEARQKALIIITQGDMDAVKQALEDLAAYGEETLDTLQQVYDTLQLLYTDDEIKNLLIDFPGRYFSAMPAVEKARAASGLALSLLFALITAGAGAAATAATKTPMFMKAAKKIQDIVGLLKKVKFNRIQRKPNNQKIAASTSKPKINTLEKKPAKTARPKIISKTNPTSSVAAASIAARQGIPPQSLDDAVNRVTGMRKEIVDNGYQTKYSDSALRDMANTNQVANEQYQVRFMEARFLQNWQTPDIPLSGQMGVTFKGQNSEGIKYWSTSFDQLEDADTDPQLIAQKVGIPYNANNKYALVIVDNQKAAQITGAQAITPSFNELGKFAKRELPDIDPKKVDQVYTPEYQKKYAGLYGEAGQKGMDVWKKDDRKDFNALLESKGESTELFEARLTLHDKLGSNEEFLGNGLTKNLINSADQQYGVVETFTFEHTPQNLATLKENGAIKILDKLTPIGK